jgi:nucleotide-binding universal stress UspA family protein
MFTQLLIAVDGSECSTRAAKYGLELARQYGAAVDVVYATRDPGQGDGRAILEEAIDFGVDLDGVDVETHLVEGEPTAVVIAQAVERGADLLVMGRHGRRGVRERLLGSVAERVLRRASAPVLTVPNGPIDAATGTEHEDILATTDGSEVAERAAPYGGDLADTLGATLHVLTVVDVQSEAGIFDAGGVDEEYVERLREDGQEALDRFVDRLDAADIDVTSALVRGETADAIDEYAASHDIDLLVMASEGEANLVGQHLGSATAEVLRTVDRAVLVIPVPD